VTWHVTYHVTCDISFLRCQQDMQQMTCVRWQCDMVNEVVDNKIKYIEYMTLNIGNLADI